MTRTHPSSHNLHSNMCATHFHHQPITECYNLASSLRLPLVCVIASVVFRVAQSRHQTWRSCHLGITVCCWLPRRHHRTASGVCSTTVCHCHLSNQPFQKRLRFLLVTILNLYTLSMMCAQDTKKDDNNNDQDFTAELILSPCCNNVFTKTSPPHSTALCDTKTA